MNMPDDNARELLLVCARQQLSTRLRERARALAGGALEWEEIVATAWQHGVASLLFHNLQSLGGSVAPGAVHLLRKAYVRAAFRNQSHFEAIAALLDRFSSAVIDVVLLKGAALAGQIYRDSGLRPFADIDLLVREEHIDQAKTILLHAGYAIAPELLSERFNRKYHINIPLVRRGEKPIHIELHWRLNDPFGGAGFDYDALFARTDRTEIIGRPARILAREDAFVYLTAHLDNHGYANRVIVDAAQPDAFIMDALSGNRLIWFSDLHELIVAGIDWSCVLGNARKTNTAGPLAVTLRLLRRLLGSDVPDQVLEQLPLPLTNWLERKVARYAVALSARPADVRARMFFRQKFLRTHKGFELRLIRLIDLWPYFLPKRQGSFRHALRALGGGLRMLAELQWLRLLRFFRVRVV